MKRLLPLLACAATLWGADPYAKNWRAVADRLIATPPEQYPFNWGEGVQQIGLMKIYQRTRDARYLGYMRRWTGLYLSKDISWLLNYSGQDQKTRPGYCGHWSPGTAILYLYEANKKPEYLALARKVNAFILDGAERSPEGGLGHWKGSHQYWVDTLYMACPLLAGLGKLEKQPRYIDDAAAQILVFARSLQDEKTGLFYHMYDWDRKTRTPSLWARGNGWVLMSIADTMEHMRRKHSSYAALQQTAARMAAGLKAAQNQDGVWHTILDDRSSYEESSATAMFASGC
ncbi:MAG: glycoside hydrolase family 88 protein [Acidobacteria bacterium]|nr:glycoside hydrolase family 88 protein [Acidobacteriota bacterium]